MSEADDPKCSTWELTTRYERLRSVALGNTAGANLIDVDAGWGLLRRSGLRAWLCAVRDSEETMTVARPSQPARSHELSREADGIRTELVQVTVAMVLSQIQKEVRS
jgi:hypothetical protein